MSARKFDVFKSKKYGNVKVTDDAGTIFVTLHYTAVVTYSPDTGKVKLTSGGWRTVTTKTAINTALRQISSLPVSVYQDDFSWFVNIGGKKIEFQDGMEIDLLLGKSL